MATEALAPYQTEKAPLAGGLHGLQGSSLSAGGQMASYRASESSRPSSTETLSFFSTSKGQAFERGSPIRRPLRDSEEDPLRALLHNQGPNQFVRSPNHFVGSPNQFVRSPNHCVGSPDRRPRFHPSPGIDELKDTTFPRQNADLSASFKETRRHAADISRRSPVHRAAAEPRSYNNGRAQPYRLSPSRRSPARISVKSRVATAPVKTAASKPQSQSAGVANPLDLENSLFALWAHHPNPFSFFSQTTTPKSGAPPPRSEGQKPGRSSVVSGGSQQTAPKPSNDPPAKGWSPGSESEYTQSPQAERPVSSDTVAEARDASEESDGAFAWYFPTSGGWLGQGKPGGGPGKASQQSTKAPPADAPQTTGKVSGSGAGGEPQNEVANRLHNELSLDKWRVEEDARWQGRRGYSPGKLEEGRRGKETAEQSAPPGSEDESLLGAKEQREGRQGWAGGGGRERRKSESANLSASSRRHSLDANTGPQARNTSKSGPLPKLASIGSLFGEEDDEEDEDVPFTFSGFFFGEPRNPRQKPRRKPSSPPPPPPPPLGKGFGSWRPLPPGGLGKPKQSTPSEEPTPRATPPIRKSNSGSALDNDSSDGQWEEDRRSQWRERRLGRRASQSPSLSRRGSGDNLAGQPNPNPNPPVEPSGLVRQTSLSSGGVSPRKTKRSPRGEKGGAKSHRRRPSGSGLRASLEGTSVNNLISAELQTQPRSEEELSAHMARHFTSPSRSQEAPPQSKKPGKRTSRASYRTDPSYRSEWQDQSDGGAERSRLLAGGVNRFSEGAAPPPPKYELLESFPPVATRVKESSREGGVVQRQLSYPPGVYPYSLSPSPAATPRRNDYIRSSDHFDLSVATPNATPQRGYTSYSEDGRLRRPHQDTSDEFPRGASRKFPGEEFPRGGRPAGARYSEDFPPKTGPTVSRDVSEEFPRGGIPEDARSRASSQDFATDSSGFGRFSFRRIQSSKKVGRMPRTKSFGSRVTASPAQSRQSSRAASPKIIKRGASAKSPPDPLSVVPYRKPEPPESFLDSIGSGWRGFSAVRWVRSLVSQKRRRYTQNGFDLDLTYITERVIAMGFPAEGADSYIRNPMKQVQRLLESKHAGHYKVYNLCSERTYPPEKFDNRVEICPFDDHQVPSLALMKRFCEDVHTWLLGDPRNIAVVHCKAGKGRTGLMVSAYLVYTGMSAEEALAFYGERRTVNGTGVTISSQRRYVFYFQHLLSQGIPPVIKTPPHVTRSLRRVRLYDKSGSDKVEFAIDQLEGTRADKYWPPVQKHKGVCVIAKAGSQHTFSSSEFSLAEEARMKEHYFQMETERDHAVYKQPPLDHYCDAPVLLTGDVRVTFNEGGSRLFYLWFNTAFVTSGLLQFGKDELDKKRGKGYGDHFAVEFVFGPVELGLTRFGGKSGSPSPASSDLGRSQIQWGSDSPATLDLFL